MKDTKSPSQSAFSRDLAVEIIDEAPCAIVATDPEGLIIATNQTLARWLDRSPADFAGQERIQNLLTAPGRIFFETHISPMLRLQGFVREIACYLSRTGAAPLPVLLNAVLRRDSDGREKRVDYTLFDVTERNFYEKSLRDAREEAEQLASIVNSSPDAILRIGGDGTIRRWNQGAEKLFGIAQCDAKERHIETILQVPNRPNWFMDAREHACGEGLARFEARLHEKLDIEVTISPIFDVSDHGGVSAYSVIMRDISETVAAKEQTKLVAQELNHRVKNILSVVTSVARQTLPRGDEASPQAKFGKRLKALSDAHDLLTKGNWQATRLNDLVAISAEEAGGERRFDFAGPPVMLTPKQTVTCAMALHELVTNSLKYGALSQDGGHIKLDWWLTSEPTRLHLTWQEHGGPPVEPPSHRGFGMRMIERALSFEFGGSVKMNFQPSGLLCRVELPYS